MLVTKEEMTRHIQSAIRVYAQTTVEGVTYKLTYRVGVKTPMSFSVYEGERMVLLTNDMQEAIDLYNAICGEE